MGKSDHAVVLLRAALVLLKLIDLTSAVKDASHTQKALDALWGALHPVSHNLDVPNNNKCPSPTACQPTGPGPMEESAEEQHLSRVIVPVLLTAMKYDIKQDGTLEHLGCCCLQ